MKLIQKQYKGYICLPRAVLLIFMTNGAINFGALGSYITFASECDWDKKHATFACLTKPDDYLASKWGCNISTIWRQKNRLLELGLMEKNDIGYLRMKYFEWFEAATAKRLAKISIADSKDLIAKVQELIAEPHKNSADLQEYSGQKDTQSFNVSSKSNLGVISEDIDSGLSKEDIDWINENVTEEKNY
jgi:hypothetical protein